MALKIEKVWANIFGGNAIKRRDSSSNSNQQRHGEKEKNSEKEDSPENFNTSAEEIENAVNELKNSERFSGTGLRLEVRTTSTGMMRVDVSNPDGAVIKSMTGAEFIRLKRLSDGEDSARGKILDQKF